MPYKVFFFVVFIFLFRYFLELKVIMFRHFFELKVIMFLHFLELKVIIAMKTSITVLQAPVFRRNPLIFWLEWEQVQRERLKMISNRPNSTVFVSDQKTQYEDTGTIYSRLR